MAKRKVRIYKAPQGKGEHRSKLKNFLFIAQQGAQVNQQQAMMDKVLSYVYDAIINQEEDPEDVYESLLKMKLDKNMASDVIEYVLQGIQNEGAARETVSRPTSKEEQAEQAFAAEEARREEEDEALMDQIMMDEGPDLQDPELEEQLFFSDEEELPQQQKGGIKIGNELADKRGYELADIEADYWQDDTRNEPIKSIFDPRYKKYRGINKYNKDIIRKHNRFIDKAHDAYDDRWSVVKDYTDSTEWMKSPQYLNFTKYSEDKRLKALKLPKGTPGHKFKDKKINRAWGATDWDANKRDEIANYAKKLPRNRTYTTDEKLNEYLEWAKQKDPEYFKKNNIEKLLSNQKKSDRFNNQVLRSIIADQGLMPEPENKGKRTFTEVTEETPVMNEVVMDSPVTPQEEFVYEPTVIPEIPMMDLDPQVIPLDMQQFEMGDMDVDFDDVRSYNPRELRRKRRQDGRQKRSKTPRVIVDRGRRRSNRSRFKFQDAGEVTNYPAPPWPFGFTVPNKNEPTWEDMQEMVPKNVKDTLSNIENKLTDSKGNLMNVKQYVKKHLKGFQPGGAQGTTQNDENSPWTINQETWKRNDKTKALVNYSQNNVAKEEEKKRLEQEHAQLMAQREQLGNFIPQGGEEMIDMRSMQQQLPQAQYGGMGARRARRMIPRGFGISPLNVKNIDVRRTGLFGRPKEYSMEIAPFDYALLAANPLLRSIYNIDALTPSVITGKKTIIDYQPIKKAIKEIENKEKEKEDTEEVIENTEETEEIEETNGSEEVIEEEEENEVVENQPNVKVKANEKGQVEDIIVTEDEGIDYDQDPTEGMSLIDIQNNMSNPQIRNQYLAYLKESTGKAMPFNFPDESKIAEFMKYQELQRKQAQQDKINKMYNIPNIYNAPTISGGFQTVPLSPEEKMRKEELELEILRRTNPGVYNFTNNLDYQAGGVPVWGMESVQEDNKGAVRKAAEEVKRTAVWKEALKKAKEMAEQSREMQQGGFPDLNNDGKLSYADILKGRGVFQDGGEMEDIPMAQRGQRFIRRDRRNSNRDQRQQARGRRRDFRRANRVLRNQMSFPTLTGPRGMNHVFSANPAFGYAGSWSKPVSGFYNKRTNTPWQGQLSPDARIKSVDVTKSGIFGRPKRYSITYGQKTGDLVKKQQTPMITMNNNNQSNASNASRANQAAMVANNNQNNPVDPRFNISQATVSNLDTTPLEYGSPIEWANKEPKTLREEYESQGREIPNSLLSQADKVWNPITNNWEGKTTVIPDLEIEEEVNYGPDGGGFVDEQPAWAEGADDYNDDYDWDEEEEEEEPWNEMGFIDGETPEVNSGDGDYGPDGGGFVTEQPDWAKDVYPSSVSSNVSPLGLMEQGVNAAMEYYRDNPGISGPDGGGFVDEQPDWAKGADNDNFQYGGCPTCPKYNFGGMTLGDEIMMSEDQIAAYMRAGGVVEFI